MKKLLLFLGFTVYLTVIAFAQDSLVTVKGVTWSKKETGRSVEIALSIDSNCVRYGLFLTPEGAVSGYIDENNSAADIFASIKDSIYYNSNIDTIIFSSLPETIDNYDINILAITKDNDSVFYCKTIVCDLGHEQAHVELAITPATDTSIRLDVTINSATSICYMLVGKTDYFAQVGFDDLDYVKENIDEIIKGSVNKITKSKAFNIPFDEETELTFVAVPLNAFNEIGDGAILKFSAKDVSVENIIALINISVYPNPAKDIINISSSEQINEVEIINLAGQIVYSSKENSKNLTINTAFLEKGNYLVNIHTDKGISTKKIVIE